jgi:hypothetical protein
MPKKKLTKKQAFNLAQRTSNNIRRLFIDKLDYGTESNVKMSIDALSKLSQRVTTQVLLRR